MAGYASCTDLSALLTVDTKLLEFDLQDIEFYFVFETELTV